jgi:hypothetical protein
MHGLIHRKNCEPLGRQKDTMWHPIDIEEKKKLDMGIFTSINHIIKVI